ncbi:MAG TPA: hypothetical protein PKD25_02220 [Rubrivivax sp.]|nr:cytochrome c [Burkholderiaceae bacterium]HMQ71307.1 hypothetical protein [Rubrivivax sp.]
MKTRRPLARALAAAALASAAAAPALAQQPFTPEQVKLGQELMQKQMATMTPELVERARALSPEIKQFLMKVALRHERRSDTLTLRQVMHDILADYQAVGAAIAVDNGAAAADAARRIAGHRLPRGGMLPYLPLDKVSDDGLSVLPAMEAAVEGGARQLADAAERGDMVAAAQHYGTITSGCVACHNHFRGQPGASAYAPRLKR